MDFFAHPKREKYIYDENENRRIFSRKNLLDKVDIELVEYCNLINQKLGKPRLFFRHPVIFDYIKHEICNHAEELEKIMSIRDQQDMVSFRIEVHHLESVINIGISNSKGLHTTFIRKLLEHGIHNKTL